MRIIACVPLCYQVLFFDRDSVLCYRADAVTILLLRGARVEKQEFMPPLSPDDVTLVRVPVPMEMPLNDTSLDETLRRIPAI